ncbi:hypothetical protein SGFS_039440 [Streptomyces graminofaciens]|uniref:Uncharacterized protein n=1 Tax=Streptomyces graminofaciens TaxID=68212 RepID=A0ABN5VH15_9ACTN|nr:hypothetical protein SGFS_039440 [Streptomyces graminofaciens]
MPATRLYAAAPRRRRPFARAVVPAEAHRDADRPDGAVPGTDGAPGNVAVIGRCQSEPFRQESVRNAPCASDDRRCP